MKKWFQARMVCYYLLVLGAGGAALAGVIHRRALATLRFCIFRGHSPECSSWELLRDEIVRINVVATVIIVALATLAVILISWSVARSASAVKDNVRSASAGHDPGSWPRPPRPHEFRNLQAQLGAGLEAYRERVGELRRDSATLREKIREAGEDLVPSRRGLSSARARELFSRYAELKNLYRRFKVGERK